MLAAMPINGWYYERGLLQPHVDLDAVAPWLASPVEVMSCNGLMRIPQGPGLGCDLDHDYLASAERVLCATDDPAEPGRS